MDKFEIRQITDEKNVKRTVILNQMAYPGFYQGTQEEVDNVTKVLMELIESDDIDMYGSFLGDEQVGSMLFYKFTYNYYGKVFKMGGIGSVAVDLLYKKEHVAKELVEYSLELSRSNGFPLYSLYPFSPRFYRNFGLGYGIPLKVIKSRPESFINYGNKSILSYASDKDKEDIITFYDKELFKTHGMVKKSTADKRRILKANNNKIVLAKDNDKIIGYLLFEQGKTSDVYFQEQRILVNEMFYSNREALMAFSSFFHTQLDQVTYIEMHTFDENIHLILDELSYVPEPKVMPLISHKYADSGLGLMYLALEPEALLDVIKHRTDKCVEFSITYPRCKTVEKILINEESSDKVKVALAINELSSWLVGAVKLYDLHMHGKLETEDPETLKLLDYQFNLEQPQCHTRF